MPPSNVDPKKWAEFVESAFKAARLPEVEENQLETGTYTNAQIAEKVGDPFRLMQLLMALPEGGGDASRRQILSFAVDML